MLLLCRPAYGWHYPGLPVPDWIRSHADFEQHGSVRHVPSLPREHDAGGAAAAGQSGAGRLLADHGARRLLDHDHPVRRDGRGVCADDRRVAKGEEKEEDDASVMIKASALK